MPNAVAGPGDRAADPAARAPAGPRAAFGAPRRAASHPQARELARPARRGDARRRRAHPHLLDVCGNVDTRDPCTICADARRDASLLVVVESVGDLWALERADATRGALSRAGRRAVAARRRRPRGSQSRQPRRARRRGRREGSVLAVNATVDGQTTAHYVTDLLAPYR